MVISNEPATENQLRRLSRLGYAPDHPLTQGDAEHLIEHFEQRPEQPGGSAQAMFHEAHDLRLAVEAARQSNAQDLAAAIARRQQFWMDTCREPSNMHSRSAQILELYMKHGCRFLTPTTEEAQEILDALDAAMLFWDRDYPQLFYQTLELNFPSLVNRR